MNRSHCPISLTLDDLGDKWSLLIIRDMVLFNKNTYGDLIKSEEGVATNILSDRLAKLEQNGFILKKEHPESKAKTLYEPTRKAIDLLPVLREINLWAKKYYKNCVVVKEIVEASKQGKKKSISNKIKKTVKSKN